MNSQGSEDINVKLLEEDGGSKFPGTLLSTYYSP
jgi:hypothetical protein